MRKIQFDIGHRFNDFTITRDLGCRGEGSKRVHFWECTCVCGSIRELPTKAITSKRAQRSCGCFMKTAEYSQKNKFWNGHQEIHGRWWTGVKNSAAIRNHKFNITIEEAWDLFLSQGRKCSLSGQEIKFARSAHSCQRGGTTASIDRIDSKKDYSIDNIQWVHKDINMMKQKFTQEQFIKMCKWVAENNETSQTPQSS